MGTAVRPNHLTTARLLTGLAAAFAFAAGTQGWALAGAAILVVSLLLDRADGVLARLSGQTSRAGHLYDLFADGASNAAVFIGIGIGLAGSFPGGWGLGLGLIAGIAVAAAEGLVVYLDRTRLQKSSDLGGRWGLDPDDAMFLVPLGMALGWGKAVLLAAAFGAPLAGLVLVAVLVGRRRQLRQNSFAESDG